MKLANKLQKNLFKSVSYPLLQCRYATLSTKDKDFDKSSHNP